MSRQLLIVDAGRRLLSGQVFRAAYPGPEHRTMSTGPAGMHPDRPVKVASALRPVATGTSAYCALRRRTAEATRPRPASISMKEDDSGTGDVAFDTSTKYASLLP